MKLWSVSLETFWNIKIKREIDLTSNPSPEGEENWSAGDVTITGCGLLGSGFSVPSIV